MVVISFAFKVEYFNLHTINQLNETIKILLSKMATKDATIEALKQAINDRSNAFVSSTEPSMVIVVPSSDQINYHRGKVEKI